MMWNNNQVGNQVPLQQGQPPAKQQFEQMEESSEEEGGFGCGGAEDSEEEVDYSGKLLNDANVPGYIRGQFVQKVYTILVVQLVLTTAIAYPFTLMKPEFVRQNIWLFYLCTYGSLFMVVAVTCCCTQVIRTFPFNYLFLFTFTILEAVSIGFICAFYTTSSVLFAAGLTAGMFFGLTLYACFTKTDYTGCGPYLFCALMGLILGGFLCMIAQFIFGYSRILEIVWGTIGAIVFSMYIVYDTQRIVGGRNRANQLSVDDYVLAALELYLDIINLFIYILSIFGDRR